MNKCQMIQGFFALSQCTQPTGEVCTLCHRRCCDLHSALEPGGSLCVECQARKQATPGGESTLQAASPPSLISVLTRKSGSDEPFELGLEPPRWLYDMRGSLLSKGQLKPLDPTLLAPFDEDDYLGFLRGDDEANRDGSDDPFGALS